MRSWVVVLVSAIGCGDVPTDLDGDGIADAIDDCHSGDADEAIDIDDDGLPSSVDPCPPDAAQEDTDSDSDGIPDVCDPFPVAALPDTQRCVTAFADPEISLGYLRPRAGETSWSFPPQAGLVAIGDQPVSIVAPALDAGYLSTTYVVSGLFYSEGGSNSDFLFWLRAGAAPSSEDVGCGIDGNGVVFVVANGQRHELRQLSVLSGEFRLRATVQPGADATIMCRVTRRGQSVTTTANVPVPAGSFGFAANASRVQITSMVIYTREDAPPM